MAQMDTINKLLKKPAPKRRTRAEIIAAQQAEAMAGTPGYEDGEEGERADPLFVRYINTVNGSRLGVPEEWRDLGGLGEVLMGRSAVRNGGLGGAGGGGRMVEEVG